jgi:dTDP-4-dehydrorhamnose reductase
MKKILVTGSNGLLGQKLTDTILSQSEFYLIATSKGENRHPIKQGYTYIDLDICNEEQVRLTLKKHRPTAIINTAAMTNVDACETNHSLCQALNVDAVKNLAKICQEIHCQLIHLSTDFIFDGENGPYTELDKPNPLSFYGQTKLQAEELLTASSCHWVILRTIIVYGIVKDLSRKNIVLWAKKALESGEPIQVVNDQWRMPTLAEDLAACCLLAIKQQARGVYNASGKDMMSIFELVEQVADFWHLDKSLIHPISSDSLVQAAKRPKRTGFVLDKSMNSLGYRPHSFKEGLAILDNQLQQLNEPSTIIKP